MPSRTSILITYTAVGILVYQVLCALGEVASSLPEPSTIASHATRCYDPALGFTLGWIYWLKYLVVVPSQLTAGHYEFILASFKVIVLLGLIILSLVLALGGGPDQDRKGFKYWSNPGAFAGDPTAFGRLRAICRTIPSAMFAYLGSELIGINILQTRNPRKAAVHGIKLTFYRILAFNIVAVALLGMLVPFDTDILNVPTIQMANVPVLPHILNACLLLFVLSSANYVLCSASRTIYRLAVDKHAPSILSRTDQRGIPVYALGLCSVLASLAYLSVSTDSKVLFDYFVNLVTMFGLLTWMSILIIHVAFVRARRVQKIPDNALVFRAPFGPYGSWIALAFCILIAVVRTSDVFDQDGYPGRFNYWDFLTSYLGLPLYLALILGYKIATRCKHLRPGEVDLQSMQREDEGRETMALNGVGEEPQALFDQKFRTSWFCTWLRAINVKY
ncbi:amino acid permease [Aspergillus terreus]|uniref:Amino acid permease n=1 Tax=Aspergillus terreus TaxID=33178 RepID=A0A5M3Z678_ASPTE|nr:hypothetical protein ATETN484_0010026600 [Aspergillus terreus]GFF18313.1 amino acid permease [Aspergillus terreus]